MELLYFFASFIFTKKTECGKSKNFITLHLNIKVQLIFYSFKHFTGRSSSDIDLFCRFSTIGSS